MAHNIPFPPRQPSASTHLPLTLISLEDWALVTLNGPDTVKYLQGQVTADIDALAADQHVLCAHCDAKGKMWSNLRLFHRGEGFAYLERRSVLDSQLAEIKKYAVFSKVTIAADNDAVLLGVAGFQARRAGGSVRHAAERRAPGGAGRRDHDSALQRAGGTFSAGGPPHRGRTADRQTA